MHNAVRALSAVAFLGAAAGIAYTAFAVKRVRDFRMRKPEMQSGFAPAITVFKPLHGDEPQLYENLRSFCDQNYPEFQLIFGANDANDPALDVARRLRLEFPERNVEVVAGSRYQVRNPKVRNLMAMSQ